MLGALVAIFRGSLRTLLVLRSPHDNTFFCLLEGFSFSVLGILRISDGGAGVIHTGTEHNVDYVPLGILRVTGALSHRSQGHVHPAAL